jgi:xylulokinase
LPQGCPVFAGAGDAATGAICLGVTEPGRGFISLGTSGQLMVADRAYRPNPDRFVHAFAHTVPDRWFQMACMLNGARPIAWVAGILGCTPSEVVALAATADPARAPLFLPYLTGERSPHGDPYIRGAFAGIEDSSDRAAMARAVTDAVAFTFADAADSFGDGLDDVPEVLAIGGGAQSDLVLQSIANATGRVIARTQGAETGPALGAALLAACGLGDLSLSDLGRMPDIAGRFYPVADPVMQVRLARYRALYAALAPISAPH